PPWAAAVLGAACGLGAHAVRWIIKKHAPIAQTDAGRVEAMVERFREVDTPVKGLGYGRTDLTLLAAQLAKLPREHAKFLIRPALASALRDILSDALTVQPLMLERLGRAGFSPFVLRKACVGEPVRLESALALVRTLRRWAR
ncbi:MAG: hypothetical protein ACKVPX_07325, partial [Myxococcaceae bacterium]